MKNQKTPLILVSGYLGSGKTTLLKHILENSDKKIAVLMNEFGDIGIDTKTIRKQNINVKEILEGCVCCSLEGEFEAAVKEIIKEYSPEIILLETTGIAEPDNIMISIGEDLDFLKLDTVVTVVDADLMIRFPELSPTSKMQMEAADLMIINKIDLIDKKQLSEVKNKVREINEKAAMVESSFCKVDVDLLFGIEAEHHTGHRHHKHNHDMEHFSVQVSKDFNEEELEKVLKNLPKEIFRVKGFISIKGKLHLLNYVAGRWNFEAEEGEKKVVFIGENIKKYQEKLTRKFKS